MSCIKKQVVIGHLHLPAVIQDIIKDFCFTVEREKTARNHAMVVQQINGCRVSYNIYANMNTLKPVMIFEAKSPNINQTQYKKIKRVTMCAVCGEFDLPWSRFWSKGKNNKIICRCYDANGQHVHFGRIVTPYIAHAGHNFRQLNPPKVQYNFVKKSLNLHPYC
jgi:hypothetical protein